MSTATAAAAPQFDDPAQQRAAAGLGIWIFLATEVLFFGALFGAYAVTRVRYPEGFEAGSRLTNLGLATLNTALLLTSSLTMTLAVQAAQRGARPALLAWLRWTIALGSAFLAVKAVEYLGDYREHLVPVLDFVYAGPERHAVEMFLGLYYLITGVHGLHVLIGIATLAVIAAQARRGAYTPGYYTPVDVTGLYWHLVDVIWLFVYPLLYLVSRA